MINRMKAWILRGIMKRRGNVCRIVCILMLAAGLGAAAASPAIAQARAPMTDSEKAKRWAVENELASLAIIERKLMIPMRDGVRIATDVYHPKDASKKYPAIWVRTPYNFNYWDVANGVPRDMTAALTAIKRGYALVDMQERGQFFSEGEWDVLGPPLTDGEDEVAWMIRQPWSNGKVGTTGCSSTAEWQLGVVARDIPGFAAFNVQGFGCGVGRIGPYYEQGNWYRGGAFMMYNINWFWDNEKPQRPMFPANTSQEDLIRLSKSWDLAAKFPPVDWDKAFWILPVQDILNVGGRAEEGLRRDDQAHPERSGVVPGRALPRQHAHQRAGPVVHVVLRHRHRGEPRGCTTSSGRPRRARPPTSSGRSSPRSGTASSPARRSRRSSASGTWATRGSTTRRSCTASSTASSRARRAPCSTLCPRSPTTPWG